MGAAIQVPSKRSEKTRRLIIDNASRIFFDRGFRDVSVEELCKVIGVSKGTFYKYFENRDALAEVVLDECFSEAVPAMEKNFASGKSVEDIIETHFRLLLDLLISRVSVPMLADMESRMPKMSARFEKMRRAEIEALNSMFKLGQAEGSIRKDIDPVVASVIFEESAMSIFRPGFLMSKGLTLNQAVSTVKAVFLNGIFEAKKE